MPPAAKKRKHEIMAEAEQDLANANTTEKLLVLHENKTSKEPVFSEMKKTYEDKLGKINEQEEIIKTSNKSIAETWEPFKLLK